MPRPATGRRKRLYHNPVGDPCERCSRPAIQHRVEHQPLGDPCAKCGLPAAGNHYRKFARKHSDKNYYAGIDGEGQGRDDHRYVMLAWSSESGKQREAIEADEGKYLTTEECLDFILDTPNTAKLFAYAFQYDLTKILSDLDDYTNYRLWRPELRQAKSAEARKRGPLYVKWRHYRLNLMASKFTVTRGTRAQGNYRRRVIWDVFKFFQSSFVNALDDWKTGDPETVAHMREMKAARSEFDKKTRAEILGYCYDECQYMAQLAHKLTNAHREAGLDLRTYYGAGSTASCILRKLGVHKMKRTAPPEMDGAVAMAFFGGRFENSVLGEIPGPVYSKDISSAYPYQTTFLPCLEHGRWELTNRRQDLDHCRTACVQYALGDPPRNLAWGPFPFRLKTNSICFPSTSGGGWVWLPEYLQGERLFPHVHFRQAWVLRSDCDCQPFADIPRYYRERIRIGKEGAGIVIKLGVNAVYGKVAQSLGTEPPFQCWVWAGLITAGTRAQLLEILGLHKDWRNLLMVATDGVYSLEDVPSPVPRDTGTWECPGPDGGMVYKPLGGWESKTVPQGIVCARPGIYWPRNPSEADIKQIRARGVGRSVMIKNVDRVVEALRTGPVPCTVANCKLAAHHVHLPNVSRFHGAKSSISKANMEDMPGSKEYTRGILTDPDGNPVLGPDGKPRSRYGQWSENRVTMSFDPLPKREGIDPDGRLRIRAFPQDLVSNPYKRSLKDLSPEALELVIATMQTLEQPDGDDFFVDYGPKDF